MPVLKDEAVVLRLVDFSETSQVVWLFGAEHGQLRLIAKGARRSTRKRFAPGLDLLELGEVTFAPPHGDAQLGILTEWLQRDAFVGLRRELLRLHGAFYAAELVATLTAPADPHPQLFRALVELLRGLAGEVPAAPLLPAFQQALAQAIGYAPNLEQCVGCRRPVRPGPVVFFSSAAGGLLCRDCEVHHAEKRRVPSGVVGRTPQTGDPVGWFELLDYHLSYVAGRRFQTAAQVASLVKGLPRPVSLSDGGG